MRALAQITGAMLFTGSCLLAVSGCDSPPSDSGVSTGGISGTGGRGAAGGSSGVGGSTTQSSSGGSASGYVGDADAPSNVVSNGYVTAGRWMGFGFTATDGPAYATITPNCGTTCTPPFTGSQFCMYGTVMGRTDYAGFAMLGWNVNQDQAGSAAQTWAVPDTGGIIVTVNNPGNTPLRLQLQGTDPHSGADRWCAPLVSGQLIPWGSLVTNCWAGGSPQNALTPGTPIQQAAIIVPGTLADVPFDLCLVDIQIQ
jgi:hypothetical protein